MTAKKCTKKRDARAELLLYLTKPIAFSKSSLPSPLSLLKLPNVTKDMGEIGQQLTCASLETIPETIMGCISAPVPFSILMWRIQSCDNV